MKAHASAFFLHLFEVNVVVFRRLVNIVVRERFDAWNLLPFARTNIVRHADNRRRIQSATKFGEYWGIGAQSSSDGLAKEVPKVLLVLRVGGIAYLPPCARSPILPTSCSPITEAHPLARPNTLNPAIGGQFSIRPERQISRYVLITHGELVATARQRFQVAAPDR